METAALEDTREERIAGEVLADADTDEERATAWYNYLDTKITFPFQALLEGDEEVEVVSLSVEEDCLDEMKMEVRHLDSFGEDPFTVLAIELEPLDADDDSAEAVEDWQYWWERGNRLNEPIALPAENFPDDDLEDEPDDETAPAGFGDEEE